MSDYNKQNIFSEQAYKCSFLANPVCPAKNMLKRAKNIRLCITNAGTALISKIMAEVEKMGNARTFISNGTAIPFRLAENTACISVDNNRYFLIDGTYLLGGRLEGINLVTDMYTRCKLKAEKHVILNSLFSTEFISAALASSMEGTTMGRGLCLIEHVSYMKNTDSVSNMNKNFWSMAEDQEETDENEDDDDENEEDEDENEENTENTSVVKYEPVSKQHSVLL
ncbi:WSSV032 [White spot syndrome virus]|uniref:WSSV032 n=1 Tax=White spot syndrome virus TaxID=342409 RepID=A0A2I6SBH4_9VIRU|nr:WSSV032 [White spot syndrome virus]